MSREMPRSLNVVLLLIALAVGVSPCAAESPASASAAERTDWSTDDAPLRVVLRDGVTLQLGPHSALRRLPGIDVAVGKKDTAGRALVFELAQGHLEVDVDLAHRPIQPVMVRAPRKVGIIAKGGRAAVMARDGNVTLATLSGRDSIGAVGERWRPVKVGRALTVSVANPDGAARDVISPPSPKVDSHLLLAMGSNPSNNRMDWSAVPGATSYWVDLTQFVGNEPVSLPIITTTDPGCALPGLAPGRYSASVHARDAYGLDSAPSAPVSLRVVGLTLPPGASEEAGRLEVPVGQRVGLTHAEGLEVTYGNTNPIFVSAPKSVGLYHGRGVVVRLRERGGTAERRFELMPLVVRVEVQTNPRNPVWPGDPMELVLRVLDERGAPSSHLDEVTPEVTINSVVTAVEWTKKPGELRAKLEKPPFPGPWVVRLAARDAQGSVLARDFVEVQLRPKPATSEF